ncbi:MAG: DUF7844 domain-containing protein [Pseudobdellovibrionaceae bacterium]
MRAVSTFLHFILCATFFLMGSNSLAFDLIADNELDQATQKLVQPWLSTIVETLPPVMKSRFADRVYTVTFTKFKGTEMGMVIPGSSKIQLNQSLLSILKYPKLQKLRLSQWPDFVEKIQAVKKQSQPQSQNESVQLDLPSHKDMGEFLTATLIHELSHQYDMLGIPPMEYLETRRQCIYSAAINARDYSLECQKIENIKTSVSDLREFLILAGFPETGFVSSTSNRTNFYTGRSPDPYEWQTPMEAFAVNMEYFLLDVDYQCRRPALYQYLSKHFNNYEPFGKRTCNKTSTVLVNAPSEFGSLTRFEELDFNKLYQVHYFFAGKGDEMMSRFGHAMLRLVFCAPYRKTMGPECLKDLTFHRVVSFRAFVTDMSINSLKGLTGDYPSSLYILPLASVLTEYNSTEFREITSVPLKLDRLQLKMLFDTVLYNHWTYEGRYYFLSNNCATETFNLLKTIFYRQPKIFDSSIARPDTLYRLLIKLGIAEDLKNLAVNKEQALKLGYYFPSFKEQYEASIAALVRQGALPSDTTLDTYLELTGDQRKQLFDAEANSSKAVNEKIKNFAGFVLLEDLIVSQKMMILNKEVLPKIYAESNDKDSVHTNPVLADVGVFQDYVFKYSRPTTLFSSALDNRIYGFPTKEETTVIVESFNKTMANTQFDKKSQEFSKLVISEANEDLRQQYLKADQNMKDLVKQIKTYKRLIGK